MIIYEVIDLGSIPDKQNILVDSPIKKIFNKNSQ